MEICQKNPNLLKVRQKYRAFCMKTHVGFVVPATLLLTDLLNGAESFLRSESVLS
jgi:hypothetical protein